MGVRRHTTVGRASPDPFTFCPFAAGKKSLELELGWPTSWGTSQGSYRFR